jgi:hypothetical protein
MKYFLMRSDRINPISWLSEPASSYTLSFVLYGAYQVSSIYTEIQDDSRN